MYVVAAGGCVRQQKQQQQQQQLFGDHEKCQRSPTALTDTYSSTDVHLVRSAYFIFFIWPIEHTETYEKGQADKENIVYFVMESWKQTL